MADIKIFSTDTDDGVISVLGKTDKTDHQLLRQIRVGNAPRGGVKFTKDGRGFVSNTSQNTISEIDPVSLEEVRRVEVGHGPRGLGLYPGGHYILVSNSGSDTVSIVDLELNVELRQVPVGRDPRHMAVTADGKFAFVSIWGEGVVLKLDVAGLATGNPESVSILETIDVGTSAHPYSVAIDPSGTRVFVANTQATYASVIDVATSAVTHVELGYIGGRAVAFSPDEQYALVSVESVNAVYVIRLSDLAVTRDIPVGPGPRGLVVDPLDETLYITNFARKTFVMSSPVVGRPNALTMVDLASASLDRQDGDFACEEITVGYGPCSVTMFDLSTLPAERLEEGLARTEV